MIALHTNVLARYVLRDDPAQSAAADAIMEGLSAAEPGFVCREVLVEFVWLLRGRGSFGREKVAAVIRAMLETAALNIEAADRAVAAVARYERGGPGFADQMILLAAEDAGARLVTFDAGLAGEAAG